MSDRPILQIHWGDFLRSGSLIFKVNGADLTRDADGLSGLIMATLVEPKPGGDFAQDPMQVPTFEIGQFARVLDGETALTIVAATVSFRPPNPAPEVAAFAGPFGAILTLRLTDPIQAQQMREHTLSMRRMLRVQEELIAEMRDRRPKDE